MCYYCRAPKRCVILKVPMLSPDKLNEAQKKAVEFPFDRALKVTAGAGTGKTTVVTFRFLDALKRIPGAKPSNILCLTFTDRAAQSMRERVLEVLGSSISPQQLWVSTFHSFCMRILAEHEARAGLPRGFRIADEGETSLLRDDVMASILSRSLVAQEERSLIPPGDLRDVLGAGWGVIDHARRLLHTAETFQDAICAQLPEDTPQSTYERQAAGVFVRLFIEYEKLKWAAGVADHADLLVKAYWLLHKDENLRARLRSQFLHILVDEFQDTNRAQLELLRLLARDDFANVTIVGDDKQAIYEWRGARIENLREFRARELFLTYNYRSYNEVLDVANFAITRAPYFAGQAKKVALSNPVKGYSGEARVHLVQAASREEEADFVAGRIKLLIGSGIEPGQIVVLYRSTTHAELLEHKFRQLDIPYTALGAGFFEKEEVRDLLAYLQLAVEPGADIAAVRILQRPPLSMTPAEVAAVAAVRKTAPAARDGTLFELLSSPQVREMFDGQKSQRLACAVACVEKLRMQQGVVPLPVLVEMAFYESGYFDALGAQSPHEAPRSISNVSKLADFASEFSDRAPFNGLPEFVQYMQQLSVKKLHETEADPQQESGAVKLLTIHKAKGLEFHTVFLIDVRANKFSKRKQFLIDIPLAGETPAAGRIVAKYLPPGTDETEQYNELLERRGAMARHDQEERRALYVALTRTMENLYVTTGIEKSDMFNELADKFADSEHVEVSRPL